MGKIPPNLKADIGRNIKRERVKKIGPQRGMSKKCAKEFGVSPQQWSPWENAMRTPDEHRMEDLARFFGVSKEYLRRSAQDYDLTYSQWQQGVRNPLPKENMDSMSLRQASVPGDAEPTVMASETVSQVADAAGQVLKKRVALLGLAEKIIEVVESGIRVSVVFEKAEKKTATA